MQSLMTLSGRKSSNFYKSPVEFAVSGEVCSTDGSAASTI
jgi:hypothetical protein